MTYSTTIYGVDAYAASTKTVTASGNAIASVSAATLSSGLKSIDDNAVSTVNITVSGFGTVQRFGSAVGAVAVSALANATKSTSNYPTDGIVQVSLIPFAAATFVPEVRFDSLYWNWPLYSDNEGYRVFYTRPGDHWREGRSKRKGAKATFRFYGSRVRIVLPQNLHRGIVRVFIDGELAVQQDLFDAAREDFLHDILDLEPGLHEVAIYPTGRSNPAAQDSVVQVGEFYYKHHVATEDQGEEIRERAWSASTSGG